MDNTQTPLMNSNDKVLSTKGSPFVFKPEKSSDAENNNQCANISSRLFRTIFIILSIIIFLPLTAILKNELHLFTIYGFGALFSAVAYAIHLFYIVFRAHFEEETYLYRVHTLNAIPSNWASMSIAYQAQLWKHQPIESISEFSAIQGGVASTMMFGCAVTTLTTLSCAFMSEIHQHSFELSVDDVMVIIGAFGLVTVGTYELDPNAPTMKTVHNIGAALSLAIILAFNYQQIDMIYEYPDNYTSKRLWYPILLDIISLIGFSAWQYFGYKSKKYNEKVKREDEYSPEYVSQLSVANLTAEGIYFVGAGVQLASWMIFYPYANCPEWVNSL